MQCLRVRFPHCLWKDLTGVASKMTWTVNLFLTIVIHHAIRKKPTRCPAGISSVRCMRLVSSGRSFSYGRIFYMDGHIIDIWLEAFPFIRGMVLTINSPLFASSYRRLTSTLRRDHHSCPLSGVTRFRLAGKYPPVSCSAHEQRCCTSRQPKTCWELRLRL